MLKELKLVHQSSLVVSSLLVTKILFLSYKISEVLQEDILWISVLLLDKIARPHRKPFGYFIR